MLAKISYLSQFIKESFNEAKKIHWPDRKQVLYLSIMVILVSAGISVLTNLADFLIRIVINYIIQFGI